jgi:hypothetical protein
MKRSSSCIIETLRPNFKNLNFPYLQTNVDISFKCTAETEKVIKTDRRAFIKGGEVGRFKNSYCFKIGMRLQ